MRPTARTTIADSRTCHWSHITGRTAGGRQTSAQVWICEYPYRTMRTSPCGDCDACEMVRHVAGRIDERITSDN